MEDWLQTIYNILPRSCCWLFGHYHGDMILSDNVFMLYEKILNLDLIEPLNNPNVELPEGFRIANNYI